MSGSQTENFRYVLLSYYCVLQATQQIFEIIEPIRDGNNLHTSFNASKTC